MTQKLVLGLMVNSKKKFQHLFCISGPAKKKKTKQKQGVVAQKLVKKPDFWHLAGYN